MEQWFYYAILTYFLWALTNIFDKILIDKKFKDGLVYSIFVGFFQLVVLLLIPFFGFKFPSLHQILLGLFVGALFYFALIPLFKALKYDDVSTVVPLTSFTPILVLILSYIFLEEILSYQELGAFALFIVGGFLLSVNKFSLKKLHFTPALKYILMNVLIFAITLILIKFTFNNVPFFEGFILLRMGTVVACIFMITNKNIRKKVSKRIKNFKSKKLFAFNQSLGIGGQFFFNLAISLGSVSLVNAAQVLQYTFLFILSIFFTIFFPKFLKEKFTKEIVTKKIIAIMLIGIALYLIS